MDVVKMIEERGMKTRPPAISVGGSVKVHVKVREGGEGARLGVRGQEVAARA